MSGKSRRKPVKLSIASSSVEEIKQEVEETADYVQFLMGMKPDTSGLTTNQLLNYTTQLENIVAYLCARNEEAGKVLERIDPTSIRRKSDAEKAQEAKGEYQPGEPKEESQSNGVASIPIEDLPQMSDEDWNKQSLSVVPKGSQP